MNNRLLSEQEICQASLSSLCAHCTCKETGKPEYIPCQLYDSTALAIAAQLAKTDKEWVGIMEEQYRKCNMGECLHEEPKCQFMRTDLGEYHCRWWQDHKRR